MNVRFPFAWLTRMVRHRFPHAHVEIRPWGIPLGWIANLHAYDRNREMIATLVHELVTFRRNNPESYIHLVGYSGGGGMAAMAAATCPDTVSLNRLILIAPAISHDFPIAERIVPRIKEFVVSYCSRWDVQVGLGTRIFGTIDGLKQYGAGAVGFHDNHPKLIQVAWSRDMLRYGHFGNHISYLSPLWQQRFLLPALDPKLDHAKVRNTLCQSG